jgi:hypothetical protein
MTVNDGADFSDRPYSRGEKILDAIKEFETKRNPQSLLSLKQSTFSTTLKSKVELIEKLNTRQRAYSNLQPEDAMQRELQLLKIKAKDYYGHKAFSAPYKT